MTEYEVCAAEELPEGERVLVHVRGTSIGVFNVDGEYYAYTDWCPHQGGPVCAGGLDGTVDVEFDRETLESEYEWVRDGEILRCPWHAWEFDVTSGECAHDDSRLISHVVEVEDGTVVLSL